MNIYMVNLSKFHFSKVLTKSTFMYEFNGKEGKVDGYYQLDPIPQMLKKENVIIDKVILFATKEVKEPVDITDESDGFKGAISPLELFKNRLIHLFKDLAKEDRIKVVGIEEDFLADAIGEAVNFIEKQEDSIDLYIDTHGGFRSTQLVQEAIMQLLLDDGINTYFYNVYHLGNDSTSRIVKDKTTNIFEFVSGIKEFDYTGRIDSIENYLEESSNGQDNKFIDAIKLISEGIQWCNINDFEEGLKRLKYYFDQPHSINDPYLSLLEDHIKYDYGKLLSNNTEAIDMVEWCVRKGFYQQALTLVESRMPDDYISSKIMKLTEEGLEVKKKYKKYKYDKELYNVEVFNGCLFSFEPNIGKRFPFNNRNVKKQRINDDKLQSIIKDEYIKNKKEIDYDRMIKSIEDCSVKGVINIETDKKEDVCLKKALVLNDKCRKEICWLFFVHKAMKNIRNRANHAAQNTGFNTRIVKATMDYYIDLFNRIKNNIS